MLARHEIRRAERIAAQEAPRNRKGSCEAGTQAEKPGLQATELSKRTRALKSFPLTHVHRAQHPNTQKVQQNGFLKIIPVSILKPIWSIPWKLQDRVGFQNIIDLTDFKTLNGL